MDCCLELRFQMATSYAAASSACMAATSAVFLPRLHRCSSSALPYHPPRSSPHLFSIPFLLISEPEKRTLLQVKASSSSEEASTSVDAGELLTDIKQKWDAVEDKSTVLLYGGGAIVAVWLSSIIVGAINCVPLLPKIMELIGLGYTGWFVYRYLLYKSSRKELIADIESLKKKIAGTTK